MIKKLLASWYGLAAIALIAGALGAVGAWHWQANSYERQLSDKDVKYEADMRAIADASTESLRIANEQRDKATAELATLDEEFTKEKENARIENDLLRAAVRDGRQRLRVAGTCVAADSSGMPGNSTAVRGPDDGTVELSREAGQNVLDIREGIKADRLKILNLQNYVRIILKQRSENAK